MAEESIRIKTTDRPLYLLAVDALQGMIKREYAPGDQLPSEEELGGMLGISRSTLRVALGILEQKEQITRKRGAGTFVSSSPAEILSGGLQYIQSILSLAKNIGLSAKMVGFQSNRIPAAEKLAGILNVTPGADLIDLKYKIYIQELPVVSINVVTNQEYIDLDKLNPSDYLFPDFFNDNKGHSISYTHSKLYAINAGQVIAEELNVEPKKALLHLVETFYASNNEAIAISNNYFVTERFNFYIGRILRK